MVSSQNFLQNTLPRISHSLLISGHVLFALVMFLALAYAPERLSYVDSAWQFFNRVNSEGFVFLEGRYGVIFSEIPLWVAIKLGCSYKALVYIGSATYILLYYIVWLLCTKVLRSEVAGWALLLWLCIGMKHSFMHTVTESHQAMAYSFLVLAVLENNRNIRPIWYYLLIFAVTLLTLLCHPFAAFTVLFVGVWTLVTKRIVIHSAVLLSLATCMGFALFRFFISHGSYDGEHYSRLKSLPFEEIIQNGSFPLRYYVGTMENFYWLPTTVIVMTLVLLVTYKTWKELGTVLVTVGATLTIISIGLYNGDSYIMMERMYIPEFVMFYIALAWIITRSGSRIKRWSTVTIIVLMLAGVYQLNQGAIIYSKRTNYLLSLMKQAPSGVDKIAFSDNYLDAGQIGVPWAVGTETFLISTFYFDSSITLVPASHVRNCNNNEFASSNALCMPVEWLNKKYFRLSNNGYVRLPK